MKNQLTMTGKAGQAGFSLMEIVLAVTIMASIALFVARVASNQQQAANDAIAKMTVSQIRLAASQCWRTYGHDGAQVQQSFSGSSGKNGNGNGSQQSSSSSDIEAIECTDSSVSTGRIVARLPEGVKALLFATSGSIEQLGAYHERGSISSSSAEDRTAFCLNEDSSISTAENLADCPTIPTGSVQ